MRNTTEILLLLATVAGAADTPAIHRCIAADGAPRYQSAPCPPDTRQDWVRTIVVDGPSDPVVAPAAPVRSSRPRARTLQRTSRSAADSAHDRRCAEARRDADETRDRLWNRLGFRERSELDAAVARACGR